MIKSDYSNLKTLVINLDDYIQNYNTQLPYLESIELNIERFSGINALKGEHKKEDYNKYISRFALNFQPLSVIGCALSHILACKYIYDNYINNYDYFLIMEDDAFPIYNKKDFYNLLNKNLNEITILDKKWDIIQLHSDGVFPNYETYNTHYLSGSTAAYLISKKAIEKTLKFKIYSHADILQHNFIKYNKYKIKYNLFWTDEKRSLNRISNYNIFFFMDTIFKYIFEKNNLLRGEKNSEICLNLKLLKEPLSNKELSIKETIIIIPIIFYLIIKILTKKEYILSYFLNLYFMFNFYNIFEKDNYNCLLITHVYAILFGIISCYICSKNKMKTNLNYLCLQLSYGIINFHFLDLFFIYKKI